MYAYRQRLLLRRWILPCRQYLHHRRQMPGPWPDLRRRQGSLRHWVRTLSLPCGRSHQRLTTPDVCPPAASAALATLATATQGLAVQPTASARPPAALVMQARWSAAPGTPLPPFLARPVSHQRLTIPDACPLMASAALAASATATKATPVQPTANARPPAALATQARWSAVPGTPLPDPSRVRSTTNG